MNEEALSSATKPCPMCGEQILATAKKCKHCGEYLDGSVRPQQSASNPGLEALAVQSQMKSIGVVALLAIFVPFLGAAYGSIAAFIVPIIISLGIGFTIGMSSHSTASQDSSIGLVAFGIGYIISIFWAIGAASAYNSKIIEAQTSKR